jgi:DNA-binding SARP family transcriptional activator
MVQFRILGSVRAYSDGGQADLLTSLQPLPKLLVAALAAAEGRPVPAGRLTEQLWGRYPPADPRAGLYTCASRARAALREAGRVDGDPLPMADGSYRLRASAEQVDVHRFRRLAAAAAAAAGRDDAEAGRLSAEALGVWGTRSRELYGPEPLAGLPGDWAGRYRTTLRREYRDALIQRLESDLRCGRHQRLVPELAALTDADDVGPPDEQLAALLMRAYCLSGRPSEGLLAYRHLHDSMRREGLEPSKELRMLEERIRRQDPALEVSATFPVAVPPPDRAEDDPAGSQPDDTAPHDAGADPASAASAKDAPRPAAAVTYSQQNIGNTVHAVQGTQHIHYGVQP